MNDLGSKQILCQTSVGDRIWALLEKDPEEFKTEVRKYFELCYPGWSVVKAEPEKKRIWIRDDRSSLL